MSEALGGAQKQSCWDGGMSSEDLQREHLIERAEKHKQPKGQPRDRRQPRIASVSAHNTPARERSVAVASVTKNPPTDIQGTCKGKGIWVSPFSLLE